MPRLQELFSWLRHVASGARARSVTSVLFKEAGEASTSDRRAVIEALERQRKLDNKTELLFKQHLFTFLLHELLQFIYAEGYQASVATVWRSGEEQKRLLREGASSAKVSLHQLKLAVDIDLFDGNRWLRDTADHKEIGLFWESLHPLCRWGGRFGDGNHYSITHGGIR